MGHAIQGPCNPLTRLLMACMELAGHTVLAHLLFPATKLHLTWLKLSLLEFLSNISFPFSAVDASGPFVPLQMGRDMVRVVFGGRGVAFHETASCCEQT